MKCRISELRYKEIICLSDGSRFGWVGDAEVDLERGEVTALIVPGRPRLFGLLGRGPEAVFPWSSVRRFGADTILVETGPSRRQMRPGGQSLTGIS